MSDEEIKEKSLKVPHSIEIMGNIKKSVVYQVVKYRICDGDSYIINVYGTFSNYDVAVAVIVGFFHISNFANIEFNDLNEVVKELTYLFNSSVEVIRIASYGDENQKFCFGILEIELR